LNRPTVDEEITDTELEAGRIAFARPWHFVKTCVRVDDLPPADRIEIAFAGRSNVGKSSLINALTGQRELARTSNTPGRTQALNIFESDGAPWRLVDMPGYGFAEAPKSQVKQWTSLIHDYLRGRAPLRRLFALIDARHGIKSADETMMNELDNLAVSYQGVLTKADKLKAGDLGKIVEATEVKLRRRRAAHPRLILTSSETGLGIDRLRAEIARLA
jgi:GTP-binding protein